MRLVELTGDISIRSIGSDLRRSRAVIQAYSNVRAQNISLSAFALSALRHDSNYTAESLSVESGFDTIIGFSNIINVAGDINLSSSEIASHLRLRRNSSIDAVNLFVNSAGEARLRREVNFNITNVFNFSANTCSIRDKGELNIGEKQGNCLVN